MTNFPLTSALLRRGLGRCLLLLGGLLAAAPLAALAQTPTGNVGIGTTAPDVSAALDIVSSTKGALLPRVVSAAALATPATGLLVFQTGGAAGFYYNAGTAAAPSWQQLATAAGGDNLGNHTATQNLNLAGNKLVGGTAASPGTEGLSISSGGLVTVGSARVGTAATTHGLRLEAADAGFTITSSWGLGPAATPVTGAGDRLMWLSYYGAFRAGGISGFATINGQTPGAQWDAPNVGEYSAAFGLDNLASGRYSFASGWRSSASGEYSVALGSRARATEIGSVAIGTYAASIHTGSFVFADRSTLQDITSSATNQMTMRFGGGYRLFSNSFGSSGMLMSAGSNSWQAVSDSTKKERRILADGNLFLARINRMRLGSWNYIGQSPDTMRHYGPMAQDFFAAFGHDGVGRSGEKTSINQADFDGVNLIAIQALYRRVLALEAANAGLRQQMQRLQAQRPAAAAGGAATLEALEARLRRLEAAGGQARN